MKYTVIWDKPAQRDLATLWTAAVDRKAVAAAANRIDQILARDPAAVGFRRSDQSMLLIVPPLAVLYDINEGDRQVFVWAVWRPQ